MTRKFLTLYIIHICALNALAQNVGEIKGQLTGQSDEPLAFATVTVYRAVDTSLIDYVLSEDDGTFHLKKLPLVTPLRVIVSYLGYEPEKIDFELSAGESTKNFGVFKMIPTSQTLDEILVQAERPPVIMHNDTIEFNASSFTTRDGATVEDLVKKLPGVVVDSEGNITANGRAVNKVRVDGKDFFGGDPRIALRNLTSDMIEKVQITDDREEDPLRLKADDEVSQILNLKLKKDAKIQAFGKAYAGGGTNERFELGGIVNNFDDTLQLSFVGYYNNLTQTNLSMHEMLSLGSFQASRIRFNQEGMNLNGLQTGGARSGFPLSLFGGANANVTLGGAKINLQYFYSDYQQEFGTKTFKVTTVRPDSVFYFNSENEGKSTSRGHNVTGGLRWTIDTTTNLNLNFGLTYANGSRPSTNTESSAFKNEENILQNFITKEDPNSSNFNLNSRLYFNKRLGNKGRNLTVNSNFNKNNEDNDLFSNFQRVYFPNAIDSVIYFDQLRSKYAHNQDFSIEANYTEPLIENFFLDIGINYKRGIRNNKIDTRQLYTGEPVWYPIDALSNDFDRKENKTGAKAGIRYQKGKVQFNVNTDFDNLRYHNYFNEEFVPFEEQYRFIRPNVQINLDGWRINYRYDYQIPDIDQLHPIVDNTNPLYIREGNPDLSPYRNHNLMVSKYAYSGKWKYRLYVSGDFKNESIINTTQVDANGVTYSRPVNYDGRSFGIYSGAGINHTFEMENQKLTVDFNLFGNFWSEPFLVNEQEGVADNRFIGTNISFNYNLHDILDLASRYFVYYNSNTYENVNYPDVNYFNHRLSGEFTVHLPWDLEFQNDVTYQFQPNTIPGFRSSSTMWNAALNKKLLESKKLTLRLSVYDLLDQNINFYRYVNHNTINDIQQKSLTRYLMLSLIYDFRKTGGARGSRGLMIGVGG